MGNLKSKKMNGKEKHQSKKNVKNNTDFDEDETRITGNLNNTRQELDTTQLDPSDGDEAKPKKTKTVDQVPAGDGPEIRERSSDKTLNMSDVTQKHKSAEKPDPKPDLVFQQATTAKTAMLFCVGKKTTGKTDGQHQDLHEKLSQLQLQELQKTRNVTKSTEETIQTGTAEEKEEEVVNNKEKPLHEYLFNQNTTHTSVQNQWSYRLKSKQRRAEAARKKLREKLKKKLKTPPGDGSKTSQQSAAETVTAVAESSQQEGCTVQEPTKLKQTRRSRAKKAGKQKRKRKAAPRHVRAVEKKLTAASNDADAHELTTAAVDKTVEPQAALKSADGKEEKIGQVELEEEETIIYSETAEQKVHTEGQWPQFSVNQSCPGSLRTTGRRLPPNVCKWVDNCHHNECEPPWVSTAVLAACLALSKIEDEENDGQ